MQYIVLSLNTQSSELFKIWTFRRQYSRKEHKNKIDQKRKKKKKL